MGLTKKSKYQIKIPIRCYHPRVSISIFELRKQYIMAKIRTRVIFKSYKQQQALLLPPPLGELIPSTNLVHVVNQVVGEMANNLREVHLKKIQKIKNVA
jgi:hypothetical protein